MPRAGSKEHLADVSSGDVTGALASVMGDDSLLIAWNRRVGRIKVNGAPLDDQKARFKRPDDAIYHTQTHEAIMGADMVAGLGLDEQIENITSRDKPDLVLHFKSGVDVWADFTRACIDLDEANDEAVRDVNRRLRIELKEHPPRDRRGRHFSPHVTLRCRPTERIDADKLHREVLDAVNAFKCGGGHSGSFGRESPLLEMLGATFWPANSEFKGWETVVASMFESRDVASLVQIVHQRIAEKTGRYPERPLWLFISISESWANRMGDGAHQEFLNAAEAGTLTFDLHEFEKVAVGVRGRTVFLQPTSSSAEAIEANVK